MTTPAESAFARRIGRPPRGNFELYSWLFMRLSGVVLLGLAVFHLFWMHIVLGVDNIDFSVVAERWQNPLWRLYDFFLLLFALTHGMNGLRIILDDYLRRPGWLVAAKSVAFLCYVLFLGMGAYIIFTFTPPPELAALP
ncbi:MAG: succinate dehydrogenase hydrophobic membrane anchor subunit [Gemmatimonadetes bacterium]|nr:succinate dehydrogenase hydrophobic membrane anchor subunit [Gemmatimonadota bacterium]